MRTHNDGLNRRSFLTRSTALLGGIPLLTSQAASPASAGTAQGAHLHLYCDESGILGKSVVFVLGMVVTSDHIRHEAFIDGLRQKHRFATQLLYNSTDRFKSPFAEAVIDYFSKEPDLRFFAYVLTEEGRMSLHRQGLTVGQVYRHFYETLVSDCTPAEVPKTLNLEPRYSIGDDRNLRRYLMEKIPNLSRIYVAGSASNDLLQIADLFTGCLCGEVHRDSLRSRVKRDVLGLLRSRLRVVNLFDARQTDPPGWFNVTVL